MRGLNMKSRVSAYDVARKAGVSQSTVSRVLNNFPHIKEGTKKKVLAAIEELGFTRDEIARSLAEKKTRTIGLIIGDITNPFFAESAGVIMGKAAELEYDVIICNTNHQDDNLEKSIKMLIGKRVDGIIIAAVNRYSKKIKELYEAQFPVVLYNSSIEGNHANFIVLDNEKGAYIAVKHLVELGHRNIAYISGPSKFLTLHQRDIGYKKALGEYGIPYNQRLIYDREFSYREIYQFAYKLLCSKDKPTSFFVTSDQMALAILDAAANHNLEVPKDVSVIGFDDINISSNQYIGLTTISQKKETMASLALEKLLLLIEGKGSISMPIQVVLEPKLIIRKTTGRAN